MILHRSQRSRRGPEREGTGCLGAPLGRYGQAASDDLTGFRAREGARSFATLGTFIHTTRKRGRRGSGFWESIDLRFCAVRSGRRWVNVVTRGFLDYRTSRSVPRLSPVDRQDFRAWQVVRPIADLPAVVRGIAGGMVRLRPRSVRYAQKSGQPTVDLRYSFSELAASYQTAEYDLWSCHTLAGYGSSIFDVVRKTGHDPFELDGMIRGGPNAYDGLPDLVRRVLRSAPSFRHSTMCSTLVARRLPVLSLRHLSTKRGGQPPSVSLFNPTPTDCLAISIPFVTSILALAKTRSHWSKTQSRRSSRVCSHTWERRSICGDRLA